MILFNLTNSEDHPEYERLEALNSLRQDNFLDSIIDATLRTKKPFLSQALIKALNFHAITCLHPYAGEYRPCEVRVGDYVPPRFFNVPGMMDEFVNTVNRYFNEADGIWLSAYVLWQLNAIHPFINGNGRTARCACFFVLCVKSSSWVRKLSDDKILPDLLVEHRDEMIAALRVANRERTPKAVYDLIRDLLISNERSDTNSDSIAETAKVEYKPKNGKYSYYDGGPMIFEPECNKENDELLHRYMETSNTRKPTREECRRWKVSFVMWMIGHKPGITREFVEEVLDEAYGCL